MINKTAFRTTATMPDASGRYRTSILLASDLNGKWSDAAKAEHCKRAQLPTVALSLPADQYDALRDNSALRFGYVDAAGDTQTPFMPEPWDDRLF